MQPVVFCYTTAIAATGTLQASSKAYSLTSCLAHTLVTWSYQQMCPGLLLLIKLVGSDGWKANPFKQVQSLYSRC